MCALVWIAIIRGGATIQGSTMLHENSNCFLLLTITSLNRLEFVCWTSPTALYFVSYYSRKCSICCLHGERNCIIFRNCLPFPERQQLISNCCYLNISESHFCNSTELVSLIDNRCLIIPIDKVELFKTLLWCNFLYPHPLQYLATDTNHPMLTYMRLLHM